MLKYVVRRIGIGLITLLALIVVTFLLVRLMPGNPFDIANLTPSNQEEMMRHYGLDKPLGEQLVLYIRNLLHGDFGISFKKSGRRPPPRCGSVVWRFWWRWWSAQPRASSWR